MTTRFIKVKAEFVLPVPYEVRDSLDAVAESGLDMLKQLIERNISTALPGTIAGSWQSMPSSWRPRMTPKQVIAIEEEIAPGFSHRVDAEDRVTFVEEQGVAHPWDQGLWIFPPDHPLHAIEETYRTVYLSQQNPNDKSKVVQAMEARLELEAAEADDGEE